jgi:hypothetical protein
MQHFSCDWCGKEMYSDSDRRFIVKMEVYAAHDPAELTEDDLDDDHLESLGELLQQIEDAGGDDILEIAPAYKKIRLDLCPGCHKRFLRDPLNKDSMKFDFSEN